MKNHARAGAEPELGPEPWGLFLAQQHTRRGLLMTWLRLLLVLVATLSLAACEVVGDIFQAGMAVGVILVVAVIALIGFIVAKIRT